MKILGIIPARIASSRFPGKPMKDILGMPMIGHCYKRANMSSVLNDVYVATCDLEIFEYIKRTFEQGDGHIPNKIIQRKPILNILTHNLLIFSNPLFKSINRNIYFFEIQRHPLYMIIQQTLNHINLVSIGAALFALLWLDFVCLDLI